MCVQWRGGGVVLVEADVLTLSTLSSFTLMQLSARQVP